jgi:hypothetical protein
MYVTLEDGARLTSMTSSSSPPPVLQSVLQDHRAANTKVYSLNCPSYVCVLSTDGDLANTKCACALPLNVAGRRGGGAWQTHSVPNTSMLAQVGRDGSLYSISLLCVKDKISV